MKIDYLNPKIPPKTGFFDLPVIPGNENRLDGLGKLGSKSEYLSYPIENSA